MNINNAFDIVANDLDGVNDALANEVREVKALLPQMIAEVTAQRVREAADMEAWLNDPEAQARAAARKARREERRRRIG